MAETSPRATTAAIVSVVIPSFNCSELLKRAVDSAFTLGLSNVEVIVVDDGSTDDTPAVCAQLKIHHPTLRLIRRVNGGLSAARNTGIEAATGEHVILLDADDELLKFDINALEGFTCDMLRIGVEEVSVEGHAKLRQEQTPLMKGTHYLQHRLSTNTLYVPSWAYVYRRSFLVEKGLRFAEGLLHEDMLFTLQALVAASGVQATNAPLYRYIRREGSITKQVSYESRRRRVMSVMRIVDGLTVLTNQHPEVDLWLWTSEAIDYGWNAGQVGRSRRLAWELLVAEVKFFIRYQHWGVYRMRGEVRWRLRTALTRFLLLRDPHRSPETEANRV